MKKSKTFIHLGFYGMVVLFMMEGSAAEAQNLTSSPYSRFGIGSLLANSTGKSLAMGHLGIGINDSLSLNLANPASLSRIDSTNFLFELGGFNRISHFASSSAGKTNNNLGFSYLAMGFPVTRWWKASLGIVPYSGVGYTMRDSEEHPTIGTIYSNFTGTGGVSRFFISSAISPVKYVSVGATFSYLFGPINHSKAIIFPSDSMYFSTASVQTAVLGDIHLSYGAQVNIPLRNSHFITLGATGQLASDIKTESRQLVTTYGNSISDTLLYEVNPTNRTLLPSGWGAGMSFGKKNHYLAGIDYRTLDWSKAAFLGVRDSMAASREVIVGMEYTPNYRSLTRYMERVRYRAGFRYGESHIQLRGSQLQEFGITFGIGLPIADRNRRGTFSSLNLSMEVGKRGTVSNSLIRESYGQITVQFTLHEYWFEKRRFN